MRKWVQIAILMSPFFIAAFFTVILLKNTRSSPTPHTALPQPSSPTAALFHSSSPVTVQTESLPHMAVSQEEDPQPVVMFVQGAPYEKVIALINDHREDEAIVLLQEIVQARPREIRAYALLGTLYYQRDQLVEAISAWEKVLEADPQNISVKASLEQARREQAAQSGFTREMTRHFTIKFEGAQNRYLYQTVLGILEEAYGTVGRALQFYPSQEVIVLLYTDQQFFDVTRAPAWSSGIFDGKIRIPSKGFETHLDQLQEVLVHEYVHAVVYQIIRTRLSEKKRDTGIPLPTWLNEGIAQYLSLPQRDPAAQSRLQRWVKRGIFIKLSELHGSFLGLDNLQAAVAYDESLSAVSYFVETFGLWRLKMLIEAFVDHGNMDEAMQSALLISYDQFQSRWGETL